MKAPQ